MSKGGKTMDKKHEDCETCESEICKELEQRLIRLSILNSRATGKEYLEMGQRIHGGKTYKVFIKVEEVL
jgi:hypothetical protein